MKNFRDMIHFPHVNALQLELLVIIVGGMMVAVALGTMMVMVVSRF
ncbi:MAG: hypothetical protein HYZ44_06930 [Bacteroidetes bacterium]|nr:hypothetical protein [Bacteroidota bacterium]